MPNLNHINRAPPRGGAGLPKAALPRFLTAHDVAAMLGLHVATVWEAVKQGRLPAPVYPAPRAPRWTEGGVLDALEATRALPSEAKSQRMAQRNAGATRAVAA